MIRYAVKRSEIRDAVDSIDKKWRSKADATTKVVTALGRYEKQSLSWSDVKPAFMALQFNKCLYCEQRLEGGDVGRINFDLDHFRPKGRVREWPGRRDPAVEYETGTADPHGYFWLAWNLDNYAATCKACNTILKSDYFPIAGTRCSAGETGVALRDAERPFLCYPLGRSDKDPEELIEFIGTVARPRATRGHKRRRAEVIIRFFELNERDDLHRQRAEGIIVLATHLEAIDAGFSIFRNERAVDRMIADSAPHASCMRSFYLLWKDDNQLAVTLRDEAEHFVELATPPDAG
ncbi:hypothetical protein [Parvularcula oceani]|uniref:hypothetical protein n=1 Tax=Parvularcula oceani TaxID=1247963 RepID=UPI00068EDBB7|nr:hypothetical protein [Parvularcula oceani]